MFRRIFLLACLTSLAAVLTAGCSADDLLATPTPPLKLYLPPTEAPVPPTEPPKATDTPAPPPTLAINVEEVKKQLAQVEADLAATRGLKPKSDVPEHFVSKEQIGYNLSQETEKNYTQDEASMDVKRLWMLLFIDDPTMDFRQMEIDFAGEQVLGYYDPKTKELFVRSDQATLSPASRETLAHELTHSLQDQYFDLTKLMPDDMEHDQYRAIQAIVEGDATVSGILYAYRNMTKNEYMQVFESDTTLPVIPGRAPVYLQEGWRFPYEYGSDFMLWALDPSNPNFKAVDALFRDPPKSTEQIMHPEKYFEKPRDEPKPVNLPDLAGTLGEGWALLESDTLGEFDLQVMLRENFIEQPEASEGWGGARYALYGNLDQAVAVMATSWDAPKDASEFYDALENSFKMFEKRDSLWNDSRRVFGLKRSGDQIMFVSGTQRDAVQQVYDSIK